MATIFKFLNQIMPMLQTMKPKHTIQNINLNTNLTITQGLETNFKILTLNNNLNIEQNLEPGTIKTLTLSHFVNIQNSLKRVRDLFLFNPFIITQTIGNPLWKFINHTLTITQTLREGRGLGNEIIITQTLGITKVRNLSIVNELDITQHMKLPVENNECN